MHAFSITGTVETDDPEVAKLAMLANINQILERMREGQTSGQITGADTLGQTETLCYWFIREAGHA